MVAPGRFARTGAYLSVHLHAENKLDSDGKQRGSHDAHGHEPQNDKHIEAVSLDFLPGAQSMVSFLSLFLHEFLYIKIAHICLF